MPRVPYIAVAVCLLVASCSQQVAPPQQHAPATDSISQTSPPLAAPAPVPPETAIQDIRNRYADVRRRLSSFREVKRDLIGLSTEGGMLQAFFDGQAPKLARATFYGETGRIDREFYYNENGHPFFVLEVESRYQAPLGATADKQEYRYYFDEGRLIRLLAGDRQLSSDDAASAARVKNMLDLSRQLLDAARKP